MDYAEGRPEEVKAIAQLIARRLQTDTWPIRFVLLARGAGDWWTALHDETPEIERVFRRNARETDVIALPPISTGEQRLAIFVESVEAYAPLLATQGFGIPTTSSARVERVEKDPGYNRPLAIHMEALLYLASVAPEPGATGIDVLLRRVLGLERDHWRKLIGSLDEDCTRDVARGVAQVTAFAGVPSTAAAERLLMADAFYEGRRIARVDVAPLIRQLSKLYGRPDGSIGYLEPDLIGEHHVANIADSELIQGCLRWIMEEPRDDQQKYRRDFLTVLQRATQFEHGKKTTARAEACLEAVICGYAEELSEDLAAVMTSTPGTMQVILERMIEHHTIPDLRQRTAARIVLLKGSYRRGSFQEGNAILVNWRNSGDVLGHEYYLHAAQLARREARAQNAVASAQIAHVMASDSRSRIATGITLSAALWSAGRSDEGLQALIEIETQLQDTALEKEQYAEFCHSACLLFHDLEKNLRVLGYAEECIKAYIEGGDSLQLILSMVNKGDALWGLGFGHDAVATLDNARNLAIQAKLPHAQDIAALCLANVLAERQEYDRAVRLYTEGIEIAHEIGHNWDSIYGQIYLAICEHELGRGKGVRFLLDLAEMAREGQYHYLEALALAFGAYVAATSVDPAEYNELTAASIDLHRVSKFPIFCVYWHAAKVLRGTGSQSEDEVEFVKNLAKCEGLKGRIDFVVNVLQRIQFSSGLNPNEEEFVSRWIGRFGTRAASLESKYKVKSCDFRACEARCCYDGTYLWEHEVLQITKLVEENRSFFSHLPDPFIIESKWHHVSGPKTAVRPHNYKSVDFPSHFTATRCVFAFEDGACSLQAFSERFTSSPWTYKPRSCIAFPLHIKSGNVEPPPLLPQEDPMHIGLAYPGYSISVPCGQHRHDGADWDIVLKKELEFLASKGT